MRRGMSDGEQRPDLHLRRATLDDVPVLELWDADADVIAATTGDETTLPGVIVHLYP